jgi:hypothetical protein
MTDDDHVFDELPRLLSGEADRITVGAMATHLRGCPDCRDELISAAVANAALLSAVRYAPTLVDVADIAGAGAAGPSSGAHAAASDRPGPGLQPLPDLSAVFAEVRAELAAEDAESNVVDLGQARRGRRATWLVAAAVVGLVVVGGGGYLAGHGLPSSPTSRPLALHAFDQGTSPASARLVGDDKMVLDASSLPRLSGGSYYEVWLTNNARTSMAPIGLLGSDGKADLSVPASEMSNYAAVEVSVQDSSGVGSYSGHSVLRGSYA